MSEEKILVARKDLISLLDMAITFGYSYENDSIADMDDIWTEIKELADKYKINEVKVPNID